MSYQHKQKGKIYVINRITTLAFRIPNTLARIRIMAIIHSLYIRNASVIIL
jgi:hypothetical protein